MRVPDHTCQLQFHDPVQRLQHWFVVHAHVLDSGVGVAPAVAGYSIAMGVLARAAVRLRAQITMPVIARTAKTSPTAPYSNSARSYRVVVEALS
jgi:hypothetical protein